MRTIVEYTYRPHPLALAAGIPPRTWRVSYRWRWWARYRAYLDTESVLSGQPILGYIVAKVLPPFESTYSGENEPPEQLGPWS